MNNDKDAVILPTGTQIKFTKELSAGATGDHPALVYANKGEPGEDDSCRLAIANVSHWPESKRMDGSWYLLLDDFEIVSDDLEQRG